MSAAVPSRAATTALWLLAAAATLLVIAACAIVVVDRSMDHDELEHAHAVWLTALGDVPMHDFLAIHPPFPYMSFAPLGRGQTDVNALVLRLRILSVIGQVLTVLLLAANMRVGGREIHALWTAVALLWMLAREWNQAYVIEFRPDSWSNAAMLAAILVARVKRPQYALFGFLAGVSVLWSPKLIVLGGSFAVLELVRLRRNALRPALAMIGGGIAALAAAWLALRAYGIDPSRAYALTIGFHESIARQAVFGYGLAAKLWEQRALAAPAAGGMLVWLVLAIRRELRPNAFEIAVAVFLIAQLLLVPFPYKQYFVPWFLFSAVFIPFWPLLLARIRVIRDVALPAALLYVTFHALLTVDLARASDGRERRGAYWQFMGQFSGPRHRVVAPVVYHPITCRDSTYAWFGTAGPDPRAHPETIVRMLGYPGVSERVTYDHYLRELEAKPPDVIVFGDEKDPLLPVQNEAVREFVRRQRYERRVIGWREVFVRPAA
ncbi:MAG TPA: hypothetical protein VNI54_06460 [Thermoanaerobaculia bacterium]|nr:hypothetical protein [Thermoanaerobaculia bacterium]